MGLSAAEEKSRQRGRKGQMFSGRSGLCHTGSVCAEGQRLESQEERRQEASLFMTQLQDFSFYSKLSMNHRLRGVLGEELKWRLERLFDFVSVHMFAHMCLYRYICMCTCLPFGTRIHSHAIFQVLYVCLSHGLKGCLGGPRKPPVSTVLVLEQNYNYWPIFLNMGS